MNNHLPYNTFDKFQRNRESVYTPQFKAAIRLQVQQYIDSDNLDAITSAPMYDVLRRLYFDCGVTYGAKVLSNIKQQVKVKLKARMPIGFNEVMRRAILNYINTGWLNDAESLTETTRRQIQAILIQGEQDGLSLDQIIQQLNSPELTRYRGRLIARTETVTATNLGAELAAIESGYSEEMQKVWISAVDNRTRRDHLNVNGVQIPFNDYFDVGGYEMARPGDRVGKNGVKPPAKEVVNCRCTCAFIIP